MKTLIIIMSVFFTFSISALDLPCKSEILKYDMPDKGFIDICMDNKNIISFSATATISGYQCSMWGKAKLKDKKYIYSGKQNCKATFILHSNKLIAEFSSCDKSSYCGSAAYWTDGEYLKDDF